MESFKFTSAMLDEDTTFIFGSWVCVVNGSDGLNSHLASTREPEALAANQSSDLCKFVDNLDKMLLLDLAIEIKEESIFNATLTRAASLLGSGPIQSVEQCIQICSGYAMQLLFTRRPHVLRPSPHWRRTWIAC